MALDEYVRSPLGILNIAAIFVNVFAILSCGLQWSNGVFIQLIYMDHVWLSLAQFFLLGSTIILVSVFIFYSCPSSETQTRLSGGGFVFLMCIALLLELFCSIITVWYLMVNNQNDSFHLRFIFLMIFSVAFLLLVMFMIMLANKYLSRVWAIENEPVPTTQFAHKVTTPNGTQRAVHLQDHAVHLQDHRLEHSQA